MRVLIWQRLPDGEVGERDTWIRWQYGKIGQSPQLRTKDPENNYVPVRAYEVVEDITSADEIDLPDLGYGDAAIESYHVFSGLTDEGVIPADVRFQVGLPTPLALATFYIAKESRSLFEQAYGRALGRELEKMLAVIPASKLAIQWEVVSEFALLEGLVDHHLDGNLLEEICTRVASLVDGISDEIEAGLHLCYGDSGHKHFCEPADAGHLVDVSNGVSKMTRRSIDWIHMPVPRERDDDSYFAPLTRLKLKPGCQLYLGLVHETGGISGSRRRIAAASKVVDTFGIATECGLGRRSPGSIPDLLQQHVELAND